MFQNREEAGIALGKFLKEEGLEADVVLGVLRGGVPVAVEVAKILEAEAGAVAVSKVGAPHNPELALGAVTYDGSRYLNEELAERLNVEGLEELFEVEIQEAEKKMKGFREPNVEGLNVLIVDDGIATGATARACINSVRRGGAEKVFLAVPVGPSKEIEEADSNFVMESISGSVGSGYREFGQVSADEARCLLEEA